VLSLGFATLMLSTFKNNSDIGAISSATLAIAVLGDLLLLPILLTLRRRWTRPAHTSGRESTV
jgi:predicted RND superfamily exporter protein